LTIFGCEVVTCRHYYHAFFVFAEVAFFKLQGHQSSRITAVLMGYIELFCVFEAKAIVNWRIARDDDSLESHSFGSSK